ncbi:MAG TPA: POTRA domain-containing protein [Candidatus Angelobacter sp.]|nr:POTRA domain-containing protein [Candidatus Angelobacter sp.]
MRPLFFALILCLLPSLAWPADHYHLARVVVTGSERYLQEDLVRATGLTVDSQVTVEDLQNAANRLGESGAFATVQYLFKPAMGTKGVEADFQVTDAEKFLPAAFENFVWFSENELQQAIHQLVPLYNGEIPASGSMSDQVESALGKILAGKGLPNDVTYMLAAEFGQLPSIYKFRIANANLKINSVTVSGSTHMLPDQLAKSIASLKNTAYLRSDVAKLLEKNLTPLYRQHGFLKFAISDIKPKLLNSDLVDVEVAVAEGDQYKLEGITWSGNTLVTSDELSKRITLKPGAAVNAVQLENDLVQVKKLFGKFGREGVVINSNPTFSKGVVAYSFEITEGDLYHMGKLEIEGLDPEQTRKLIQSWKLPEGEPYDNTYVLKFLANAVVKIPGHKWEWMSFEQIDDSQKIVNVRLQLKME